jgi:tetratricopeptide (TPR) repeat protein
MRATPHARAHAARARVHSRRPASQASRARLVRATSTEEETPERILRVSRNTTFEGLKAARRVELEKARASDDEAREAKVEWAYDALIDQSRKFFEDNVEREETAQTRFMLGNFYESLEKFDDAEREYRRALDLGVSADAANNLAMLLQRRGALDEAEAYYLKALEVNEDDVDVLFNWATLKLNERGDLDATRILIEKIVTIQPELRKHPLVKALRGDDDDDDDEDEPFVPPI